MKHIIQYSQTYRALIYSLLTVFLVFFMGYCMLMKNGMDFNTYFIASHAFHEGIRAYLMTLPDFAKIALQLHVNNFTSPYYYPPLTAQLILPLTFISPDVALFIWSLLSILAVVIAIYLLTGGKYFPFYLIIAFAFRPTETTLHIGQVNAFVLLALSFAYYGMLHNKIYRVGLGIAAGIMLKIIPVAHLCYFVWRGQLKVAVAILGFLVLFFVIGLSFVDGWQGWKDFLHTTLYYGNPASSLHAIYFNQALSGVIARLLSNNFLVMNIWYINNILLIIVTALICWPRRDFTQAFPFEFSLITVTIILAMPYTWYHQYIILLIPLVILLQSVENDVTLPWWLLPLAIGWLLTNCYNFNIFQSNLLLSSLPAFFAIFLWLILAYKIVSLKLRLRSHSFVFPLPLT